MRDVTWRGAVPDPVAPPGIAGWLRALARGGALVAVIAFGLAVLLLLRLPERVFCGAARPVTPRITRVVCLAAFPILGIGWRVTGVPLRGRGAMVANHVSWLDIFALNACRSAVFVAKAEVAGWPGIGLLARATGTLFIRRDPREAPAQRDRIAARLRAGDMLILFPEGTSTDGRGMAPFKPALFAGFAGDAGARIQPVSLVWRAPAGEGAAFYGWWGDMLLAPHLLKVLAAPRQGGVELRFHPPLDPADFPGRKALAAACERAVRDGLAGGTSHDDGARGDPVPPR